MTILTYSMLSYYTMSQIWMYNINLICIIQNNFYDLLHTKVFTFNDYMNYSYLPLKCKNHCFFNVPRFTNS